MESHGLEVGTLSRELDNNKDPNAEEPRETVYRDLLRQLDRIHTSQEAKIDELSHEKETLKAALVKLQREGYHAGRMASKESSMSSLALGLPSVSFEPSQTEGLGEVLAERAGSDAIPATTGDERILAISHGLSEVDVLLEDDEEKPQRRIQLHPRWEENLKVFAAVSEPNYAVPWAYKPQDEFVPDARTGTAFAVAWGKEGNQWLLTNAHVVRHAAVVQVRKRGDHQKFIATVLCVGLDCDLAVLTVNSAKFWEGLPRVVLTLGSGEMSVELPKLQDEVTVVGYPIGGDNACVTVGVVSRIDMQRYNVCWSRSLLAIQIDAAINPGNSGGAKSQIFPAKDWQESGSVECIGVAFQVLGRDDAENIGYIIPSEVVNHFLVDYVKHKSGILVRRVDPSSSAGKVLKKGDIIRKVQGQDIGDDGKVPFRGARNERTLQIDFHYLISKLFIGDNCSFQVLRDKHLLELRMRLSAVRPLVLHDPPDPPKYFVVGGLVFDFYNVTLLKFNGQQPKNLENLINLVKASKDEYLTFEIERNNSIILPRKGKEALKQTANILKEALPRFRGHDLAGVGGEHDSARPLCPLQAQLDGRLPGRPEKLSEAVATASQLDEKKLVSSGPDSYQERRGCQRCILPPSDPKRMAWDLMGMVLLLYDMIAIPISAFDPGSSLFTDIMEWTTQIFWTFDIFMSLITGYVSKGQIVMSPFPIFIHYLKTWFLLDVIVVGPDWFMTFVALSAAGEDEGGSTSVSRLMRSIRVVRTVRLLRLVKLKRILDMLKDRITSEVVFILLNILKLIILLLLVNHFIAALWYSMGSLGGEGVPNWRDAYNMRPEQQSIYYRYATSLHWSLTQFTPATVDVHPQNMVERTFAILVLIFGLVLFSSFISSITASMTQLRNMQEDKSKQFWLLRRYLQQKQVPPDLGFKVLRYTEYATCSHGEAIPEHRITILGMLTKQLRSELRFVTHYRCLRKHGFFELVSVMNESVLHMMSSGPTLITKALAAQDPLFDMVDAATAMYFVDQGAVQYTQASISQASVTATFGGATLGVPDRLSDKMPMPITPASINHLSLDPEYTMSMEDLVTASQEAGQVIQPGGHLCEVALWAKWKHVGSARAVLESSIVLVSVKGFAECIRRDPAVDAMASVYAKTFVQLLNDSNVVAEEEQETSCPATKTLAEDLWHEYTASNDTPNQGNFMAAANRFINLTRKGMKERAFSFSTG
eukprot:s986_g19.t1